MALASGVHGERSQTTEEHWRCASSSSDDISEHPSNTPVMSMKVLVEIVWIVQRYYLQFGCTSGLALGLLDFLPRHVRERRSLVAIRLRLR